MKKRLMQICILFNIIILSILLVSTKALLGAGLPESVTVATEEEEEPQIDMLVDEVARHTGASQEDIDSIFHPLRREIDRQREAGHPATLYPQSIFKIISTGMEKKYDLEQIGVILAKGQKAISKGESADEIEDIIVGGFKKGLKPTEIYKLLRE